MATETHDTTNPDVLADLAVHLTRVELDACRTATGSGPMSRPVSAREEDLVDAARWARRYFSNPAGRGMYDDILILRRLTAVLGPYDDVPATHDADRREQQARIAGTDPRRI